MSRIATAIIARARQGGALTLGIILGACAGSPPEHPDAAYSGLPAAYTIEQLPFYPQIEDQCGPASLATMLSARDIHIEPESLREKIYIPGKEGSLTTEIVARARQYGLLVYPLLPELSQVLREVGVGNPVLVMQNLGYNWLPRWHFSVVIGFNLETETITLRSGNTPSHEIPFDLFRATWQRAQRWAVVIVKPDQIPATARRSTYIQAANELEQVGEYAAALGAYNTALGRWPDHALAYFGAGNAAYALADFRQANDFYNAYVKKQPESPQGWNNLAYSLMKSGCPKQSLTAINCALRLLPEDSNLQDSRVELDKLRSDSMPGNCPDVSC